MLCAGLPLIRSARFYNVTTQQNLAIASRTQGNSGTTSDTPNTDVDRIKKEMSQVLETFRDTLQSLERDATVDAYDMHNLHLCTLMLRDSLSTIKEKFGRVTIGQMVDDVTWLFNQVRNAFS